MFFKRENLYLFLTLILIISTNIYLTCQLLPKKEGLNVKKISKNIEKTLKKDVKKLGKTLEKTLKKDILGALTKLFITIIKNIINSIPYNPLRRYFLSNVKFKKDIGTVIKQVGITCLKIFITVYFIGGFIFQFVPTFVLPYTPTVIRLIGKALTFIIKSLMNILFKGGSQGSISSLTPPGGMPPGGMAAPGGMPPPGGMAAAGAVGTMPPAMG